MSGIMVACMEHKRLTLMKQRWCLYEWVITLSGENF